MVPKMVKNVGALGLFLVAWTMWRAGVLAPYLNDYTPEVFAAPHLETSAAPHFLAEIIVDPTTVYGTPFDGADVGGVMGPFFASGGFTSPPDVTLCLITLAPQRPQCRLRMNDERAQSYCVNAFSCTWSFIVPKEQAYGLVLLDIDTPTIGGGWDYVDAVMVLNNPNQDEFDLLDKRMRTFIGYAAPTHLELLRPDAMGEGGLNLEFNRPERERREAPFPYFTPAELSDGVMLAQSQLRISYPN